MRRMFSEKQIKEMSALVAQEVKKDIATLVDKDGHERFIEGNITTTNDKLTIDYGKWSLAGSHLMIVLAFTANDNVSLLDYEVIATLEDLPNWVKDKIFPIKQEFIDFKSFMAIPTSWVSYQLKASLVKDTNKIQIESTGNQSVSAGDVCRMSFDLLIDNE